MADPAVPEPLMGADEMDVAAGLPEEQEPAPDEDPVDYPDQENPVENPDQADPASESEYEDAEEPDQMESPAPLQAGPLEGVDARADDAAPVLTADAEPVAVPPAGLLGAISSSEGVSEPPEPQDSLDIQARPRRGSRSRRRPARYEDYALNACVEGLID